MRVNKTDQLRVRLTKQEREALEKLLIERDQNETISDVIREALNHIIHPDTAGTPVTLSKDISARIDTLAKELNRAPRQVVEDCVQGILDMIDLPEGKLPLIVREVQLRAEYKKKDGR